MPVVIGGFWRAFNKKGLQFKKKGVDLSVTFKEPLVIDYDAPAEKILEQVMDAIEQSKQFMMQGRIIGARWADEHWIGWDVRRVIDQFLQSTRAAHRLLPVSFYHQGST